MHARIFAPPRRAARRTVRETARVSAGAARRAMRRGSLFLFDEPTTGLHFADIAKLLKAFRKLIAAGNSLVVIEHNLDVIRASDWIVDLGPEGGEGGGEIVAAGTPTEMAANARSHTGVALREYERTLNGTPPLQGDSHGARGNSFPGRCLEGERAVRGGGASGDPHPQRPRAQPPQHRRADPARSVSP